MRRIARVKALVADDGPLNRKVALTTVEDAGAEADGALRGRVAPVAMDMPFANP